MVVKLRKKTREGGKYSIVFPDPLIEKIDALVKKGYYRDVQDFIMDACRDKIKQWEKEMPDLFLEE